MTDGCGCRKDWYPQTTIHKSSYLEEFKTRREQAYRTLCYKLPKTPKIWFDEDQNPGNLLVVLHKLGTQALQPFRGDLSNGDQRVELFLGVFLIIPLACDPDADAPRHTPDTTAPDVLVELHIDPDVRGAHCLLRELPDFLDSIGGFLLEGAAGNQDELPVIDNWFETSGISAYM